jgi:hypothetical protein
MARGILSLLPPKKKYGFMAHNLLIYPQVDGHSHKKAGFSQPP